MPDRQAAVGVRILGPFATARGFEDPNSLQNLNTEKLPDDSLAMVADQGSLYRFDRASTLNPVLPSDPGIIVPASGPGRWLIFLGQELALSFSYQIAQRNTDPVVVPNPQAWSALAGTTAWTVEDAVLNAGSLVATAFWSTTTPSAGILTYNGPDALIECYAEVALANAEAGNAQNYGLYISKNGTGLGTSDQFVRETQNSSGTGNEQDPHLVTALSRLFLVAGDTVQIAIINRAIDGDDVAVSRASLAVNLA